MRSTRRFSLLSVAAVGVGACGLSGSATAAVITPGNTTTVAAGATAPGVNTDYTFFGANAATRPGSQPTNLTHFTLTTLPPNEFGAVDYTSHDYSAYPDIKAPGSSATFRTGIGYGINSSTAQNLATFVLASGSGINQSFSMYILYGNTNGTGVADASIGVSANGGAAVVSSFTDTTSTNQFIQFDITGANEGDTFTVSATRSGTNNMPYIGGVTFSSVVPEPATMAVFTVIAGLGLLKRHRASV